MFLLNDSFAKDDLRENINLFKDLTYDEELLKRRDLYIEYFYPLRPFLDFVTRISLDRVNNSAFETDFTSFNIISNKELEHSFVNFNVFKDKVEEIRKINLIPLLSQEERDEYRRRRPMVYIIETYNAAFNNRNLYIIKIFYDENITIIKFISNGTLIKQKFEYNKKFDEIMSWIIPSRLSLKEHSKVYEVGYDGRLKEDIDGFAVWGNAPFFQFHQFVNIFGQINFRELQKVMYYNGYIEYYYSHLGTEELANAHASFQKRVFTDNGHYFSNAADKLSAHGIVSGEEYESKFRRLSRIKLINFPDARTDVVRGDSTIYMIKIYNNIFETETLAFIEIVRGYRISIVNPRDGTRYNFKYNKDYEKIMAEMIPPHPWNSIKSKN
jgi:hypothetical protein